jgi:hypothetical protein
MTEFRVPQRPRFLRQMVANGPAIGRIREQMLTGQVIQRAMLVGPTWSGKTTLAHIMAHYALCQDRRPGRGDVCGDCASCRLDLAYRPPSEFLEWSETNLRYHWKQFAKLCKAARANPEFVLFIKDAQFPDLRYCMRSCR